VVEYQVGAAAAAAISRFQHYQNQCDEQQICNTLLYNTLLQGRHKALRKIVSYCSQITEPLLLPCVSLLRLQLCFLTSQLRGSGTDSTVHFELHGERGSSGPTKVAAGREAFERGVCGLIQGGVKRAVCESL
jgi:hypothetical protein